MYVLFLEVTLPELANTAALDALHHLERLFVGVAGVTSTQLLQNTEDPRVLLLQVSSRAELLQTVRQADLNLENVKTRVWGFMILETPVTLPSAWVLWSYQVRELGFILLNVVSLLLSPTIITLDGLAASGKSSVAKGLAVALGVPFISSGLLYRLVALAALETNTDASAEAALLEMLQKHDLRFEARAEGNTVFLNQTDVTALCHSSKVDAVVSVVAQHPQVRTWVNTRIRRVEPPLVAEGRDMGTNVFPNAAVKFFLTASSLVRAKRRVSERSRTLAEVQASIETRDAMDAINSAPASDAILLDSSNLNLEQTIEQALTLIKNKLQ